MTIVSHTRAAPGASATGLALPLLAFLSSALIIFARRPDVLIHPEMWAEDARFYYQDVYNLGLKRSLLLPQAGYFQTFSVLGAWIARFFALAAAPLVMAILALAVQALPVGLIFSRRANVFISDWRARTAIALIYLLLPNEPELDATMVNAQWFLIIAALMILFFSPPARRWYRALDAGVLILAGLTGPFALILAPVAWFRRFTRGRDHVPDWVAMLLSACFVIQVLALTVISHHDRLNPGVELRPHPILGATPSLFAQMVGGRVVLGTVIGETTGMTAPIVLQWAAIALVGAVGLWACVRRQWVVLAFLLLGVFTLGGALVDPSAPSPAWPILAFLPPSTQRYFFLAELSWAIAILCIASRSRWPISRLAGIAATLTIILVAGFSHWSFPAVPIVGYHQAASRFASDPAGSTSVIPADPQGWSMTLVKR